MLFSSCCKGPQQLEDGQHESMKQSAPLKPLSAPLLCLQVAIVSQEPILFAERCAVNSLVSAQRTECNRLPTEVFDSMAVSAAY